ncbi:hypothetical protein Tco_1136278 [Tanacetum coccineum]
MILDREDDTGLRDEEIDDDVSLSSSRYQWSAWIPVPLLEALGMTWTLRNPSMLPVHSFEPPVLDSAYASDYVLVIWMLFGIAREAYASERFLDFLMDLGQAAQEYSRLISGRRDVGDCCSFRVDGGGETSDDGSNMMRSSVEGEQFLKVLTLLSDDLDSGFHEPLGRLSSGLLAWAQGLVGHNSCMSSLNSLATASSSASVKLFDLPISKAKSCFRDDVVMQEE